ncbi:hypothetical protein Pint_17423 [Pistacia integerrima]|uniref:Uncharacterized protein n=1 Tax=Pistacia integerrima TaxID=434235 RepID=A0ACC0YXJ2_9ROSI|nr:hypothetical protein Pint_17423 [Pistacia integerrima]
MRTQSSLNLYLTLIILLAVLQITSCRNIKHVIKTQETGESSRTNYTSMFQRSFSAMLSSMESGNKKGQHFHTVSHRLVPGGPNLLHN